MPEQNDYSRYERRSVTNDYSSRDPHPTYDPEERPIAEHANLINRTPTVANGSPDPMITTTYRNGYQQGRVAERRLVNDTLAARETDHTAWGMLLGIILASLLGVGLAIAFLLNQRDTTVPAAPTAAPTQPEATDPQTGNTEIRERVIERTREIVPVPQPQAPATPEPSAPIIIQQQPAAPAPAPAPAPPAPTAQPEAVQPAPEPAPTSPEAELQQPAPGSPAAETVQ